MDLKTSFDTDAILYGILSRSPLKAALSGGIYVGDDRPADSMAEDVVINTITLTQEYHPQQGVSNVNVYVSDKAVRIGDKEQFVADRVRLKMGMVFQYSALFDSMTVGENVAFGLREHKRLKEAEIVRIVREKLHLVGLDGSERMMPGELSGGMKKRVSLARAIAIDPSIILYDEPSSGLDPLTSAKIDDLIIETQKKLGVTSIVVTHDMASACRIADRIAMLHKGSLIALDTVEGFRKLEDPRVRAFFRAVETEEKEAGL